MSNQTDTTQAAAPQVPPGCWQNKYGHFVPLALVAPDEQLTEMSVRPLIEEMLWHHEAMADLKARIFEEVDLLEEMVFEKYGVKKAGKKKDGVTYYTYDGEMYLRRRFQDMTRFKSDLKVAEQLIREFIADLKDGADADTRVLLETLLERNKEGDIRRASLIRMRGLKFADARWKQAMEIIAESEEVIRSACYYSVARRDSQGEYIPVPMDFAAIRPRKAAAPLLSPRERELLGALQDVLNLFDDKDLDDAPELKEVFERAFRVMANYQGGRHE